MFSNYTKPIQIERVPSSRKTSYLDTCSPFEKWRKSHCRCWHEIRDAFGAFFGLCFGSRAGIYLAGWLVPLRAWLCGLGCPARVGEDGVRGVMRAEEDEFKKLLWTFVMFAPVVIIYVFDNVFWNAFKTFLGPFWARFWESLGIQDWPQ